MINGNMRMQHWQGFINATININQVPAEYFSTERGSTLTRNQFNYSKHIYQSP